MFLKALPARTGTNSPFNVPFLTAVLNSSSLISSSLRYFSRTLSSASATTSSSSALFFCAISFCVSSNSFTSHSEPSSLVHICAFNSIKSITPTKSDSAPIGICITAGRASSLSTIDSTPASKSAPVLSNLLIKQILGTLYLSACLHTVSD